MNTTAHVEEQSSLFSTFSLQHPLPREKTNLLEKGAAATEKDESPNTGVSMTPVSFLFRMYITCGILRLSIQERFTAFVLLHRYVQAKQNAATLTNEEQEEDEEWEDDIAWVGAVCLFLACKAEDQPRRLRDAVNMVKVVLSSTATSTKQRDRCGDDNKEEETAGTTGQNNDSFVLKHIAIQAPPELDDAYWRSKSKIIETEQVVLRWLGFNCSVSRPHETVYWILELSMRDGRGSCQSQSQQGSPTTVPAKERECLESTPSLPMDETPRKATASSKEVIECDNDRIGSCDDSKELTKETIRKFAFRRLNTALFYPRALQWGVVELACAAIDMAVIDAAEQSIDPKGDTKGQINASVDPLSIDKSIFKAGWWKEYEVSNKDIKECKNDLKEATSYMKFVAETKD